MLRHHIVYSILFFNLSIAIVSCDTKLGNVSISVTNQSNLKRSSETIEINLAQIEDFPAAGYGDLIVLDDEAKEVLSQLIDINQDSIYDYIIFQSDFEPNESKTFALAVGEKNIEREKQTIHTFCRIVPERMDDFAWENDKVAFRSYGPECQRLFEEGIPGGLISSGIDAWTKRVDYPIIDKWYEAYENGVTYHEDHGEGLDAYHVGTTRGCGGTAILQDEDYILSKNFVSWKILANGPIRSVFELEYVPVEIGGQSVGEKKRITLDLESNLYHCKVFYDAKESLNSAAVGLALHGGKGTINQNKKEGWVTYWEPYDNSELGTAVLLDPEILDSIKVNDTLFKDESLNNIWTNVLVENNIFDYWAGFGWKKSGDFHSQAEWDAYLKKEFLKKNNPIQVKFAKN